MVFLEFCVILSFNKERAKDHVSNACIQGGNPIGLPLAMEARGQGSKGNGKIQEPKTKKG